jgi:hypothetical protein
MNAHKVSSISADALSPPIGAPTQSGDGRFFAPRADLVMIGRREMKRSTI